MRSIIWHLCYLFLYHTATTNIYTLSLHDALPISGSVSIASLTSDWSSFRITCASSGSDCTGMSSGRSEEHTSELQSLAYLVCRLLLEKKKPLSTSRVPCAASSSATRSSSTAHCLR